MKIVFRQHQRQIFWSDCIGLIVVCGLMWKVKDAKNVLQSTFSIIWKSPKSFGIKRNLNYKGGQLLPISWFLPFHVLPLIMICYRNFWNVVFQQKKLHCTISCVLFCNFFVDVEEKQILGLDHVFMLLMFNTYLI